MLQKRCKTDEFCFRKRRQRQKKSKARCWQVELQGMRGGGEIAGLIIAGSLSYQLPPVSVQLWRSKSDEHFQLWSDEHFHFLLTPHSLPSQRCSRRLGRSLDHAKCRLWKRKQMWTECQWKHTHHTWIVCFCWEPGNALSWTEFHSKSRGWAFLWMQPAMW